MKTTIKTIIIAAATVFAAISCQKEVEVTGTQGQVKEGESIELDIKAGLGDLVSIDDKATATSVVRLTWEEGDEVDAYCGTTKLNEAPITVTPSANKMFASLTGTITAPAEGNTITFVYSKGCEAKGLAFDFSSQTADDIPFVAYGTLRYEGTTITNKMVEFKFATSIMKIVATNLASDETIKDVTIGGINTKVTLTPSQSGGPAIAGGTRASISTGNFIQSTDGTKAIITAGLVPDKNTGRELVVTQNEARAVALTSTTIDKSTSYVVPSPFAGARACVIIGGLKWATMNIGASSVTDYGDYFAWGAAEMAYSSFASNKFTFVASRPDSYGGSGWTNGDGFAAENAPYYNGSSWVKYTGSSSAQLESGDDVATQMWGGKWRMPTKDEFKALYDICIDGTSYKTDGSASTTAKGVYWCADYNGAKGLLFIATNNGPHLFFPAAGIGGGTSLSEAGSNGYYWSSSLSTSFKDFAYSLYFTSTSSEVNLQNGINRFYGFPVRPVSD